MFKVVILLLAGCAAFPATRLPQGWTITPEGKQIRLTGDFPAKIIETPDSKHILVVTGGYHDRGLYVLDARAGTVVSDRALPNVYGDFAFDSRTGQIFIAGGDSARGILRGNLHRNRFQNAGGVEIAQLGKRDRYITGIVVAPDGALFAVDINTDTVFRLTPGDYHVEASAKAAYGAYRAALSPDGKTLAVSNWGDQSVSLFSADRLHHLARIQVGIHPNDLLFARDGRLFVANAGSNSVSVIRCRRVEETVKTSIDPDDPVGSTPDALAIDPRGKTLFVANADNNDVAVIDITNAGHSELEGFIPTGWYPSAVAVSGDGKQLYVGVAKGLGSRANVPAVAHPIKANSPVAYDSVGHTLTGYISIVPVPSESRLRELTRKVIANRPQAKTDRRAKTETARIRETVFPKIRHVLYIIRENRTYDQVLGDLGEGNGDPSLTMFGEDVTPNAHKLARQFTLLDKLFVNGEVSENGHQWSDAAYATQFTSQAWLASYGGRTEPKKNEGELGADERLRSSPAGYIWDNCARHGVSFRTYGEFAYFHPGPDSEPRYVAKGLEGHASVEWLKLASTGWTDITKGRDPDLAKVFIREMRAAEKTGEWPRFMVMSLGEDHTHALRPGHYTPRAMVASNDQALGEIVEAVSHSRFWPETAIFVIEDDAQDGPDHVDCRRTVGFVISPYTKRRSIDHSFYTTAAMIHTMELILGLPTMTQFDRAAAPMYPSFMTVYDLTPFVRAEPKVDLFAKNPTHGPDAEASLKLDFSEYDRADPAEMNRILWRALKPGIDEPAPVRSMLASDGR